MTDILSTATPTLPTFPSIGSYIRFRLDASGTLDALGDHEGALAAKSLPSKYYIGYIESVSHRIHTLASKANCAEGF